MSSLDLNEVYGPDGTCVVVVAGELDDGSVGFFEEGLARCIESARKVVIDLTGCTSISSFALRVLVQFHRRTSGYRPVTLVSSDPHLTRQLGIVGLTSMVPTDPTVEADLGSDTLAAAAEYRTNFGRRRRSRVGELGSDGQPGAEANALTVNQADPIGAA